MAATLAATSPQALSRAARVAFASVLLLAVLVSLCAVSRGLSFVWLGIAVAIFGPLVVAAVLPRNMLEGADWAVSLGEVVRMRRFWVMIVVSVSINICWHFLVNWIPTVSQGRARAHLHDGQLLERDPVPGGRRGEPRRRMALAVAGGTRSSAVERG